jgi:hypothetical protein
MPMRIIIAVAAGSTVCRRSGIGIADANVVRVVHGEHQGAAEVRSHRSIGPCSGSPTNFG